MFVLELASVRTLYIYLDESGNFDFSPCGTKHFVLCAMTTFEPVSNHRPLLDLKYELLNQDKDVECFHASEDEQLVRNRVFESIKKMNDLSFHFIYAEKSKANPAIREPSRFYATVGKPLLNYCLSGGRAKNADKVIVIIDRVLSNKQQKAFKGLIKPHLKTTGKPYGIYFHQTKADFNAQIADYASWSLYVNLERREGRPLKELDKFRSTSFDIFERGQTRYYQK